MRFLVWLVTGIVGTVALSVFFVFLGIKFPFDGWVNALAQISLVGFYVGWVLCGIRRYPLLPALRQMKKWADEDREHNEWREKIKKLTRK